MLLRKKYINPIEKVLTLGKSIFLIGARQVGKTTLMKSLPSQFPTKKIFYINIDEISSQSPLSFSSPQEFENFLKLTTGKIIKEYDIICLDEIIRIKDTHLLLKGLIDTYGKEKQFICSASGNYDAVNQVLEGLSGRIVNINVYPFDFSEFLEAKGYILPDTSSEIIYTRLEPLILEYMSFGGYPEVVMNPGIESKKILLKSIVDAVFDKDIKLFIKQEKIFDLKKTMNYIAENIGSLISYEGMAKTLGMKVYDIRKFLDSIEKSYLFFEIPPFYEDSKTEYSQKQKGYFSDFGIMNYLLQKMGQKIVFGGADTEMFSFLQLQYNKTFTDELYYYQKINGSEIDFILKTEGSLIPIEVKSQNKDSIPKIFFGFHGRYQDKIDHFIKTTTMQITERKIEGKTVYIQPFRMAIK